MNRHAVGEQARRVLNAYFEVELGHSLLLEDAELIARQRASFLRQFGPERLAEMGDAELLRALPYNLTNDQPMDYWLEFRYDQVFSYRLFGSISGGSAAKFGTWQDKGSGQWRAKAPGSPSIRDISEDQALGIIRERRQEMLAAVAALQPFSGRPSQEIDPEVIQAAVAAAAPRWRSSTWLHKYLHLNFPGLITWRATSAYLQSDLYHLGVAATGSGPYALDVKLIQFWDSLPALRDAPIPLRYRLNKGLLPRDHWCFALSGDVTARDAMLAGGYIGLGPARVGSLAGIFSLTRKKEVREGLQCALQDAEAASSDRLGDLLNLGYALKPGSLVALLEDAATVLAVGEVSGAYRHVPGERWPHQIPVRWLHQQCFELFPAVETGEASLAFLESHGAGAADLEASLLVSGIGIWPGFSQVARSHRVRRQIWTGPGRVEEPVIIQAQPLEPAEGITGQILDMLEHKPQVILYGPPGTGKTYHAERIALEMVARHNFHCSSSRLSQWQQDSIYGRDGTDPYIVSCTFHPTFAYEDFIEGYRPAGQGFVLQPGLFRRLVATARARPNHRFVLIIDEINRGNLPKIFGELITLLEPAQRGIARALLPLSGDILTVPPNLYLIGTMNTADRSVLVLDTALRRRFGFKELMPDPLLLKEGRIGELPLSTWFRALNRRIVEQLGQEGRNLQIGHAYFLPDGRPASTLRQIAEIVCDDIWPLLQEYCYENPRTLASILATHKGGIYDRENGELRYSLFEPGREEELIAALMAIVTPEDRKVAEGLRGAVG